jgi:hypothetical protein
MFGHIGLRMLLCRIAGVGLSGTYALFGIFIRGHVDLAALQRIVAARRQEPADFG